MRIIVLLSIALSLFAQEPKKKGPPPPPKNLKLLKPEEIRTTMGAFRVALGGQCTMCHVQGDFASDDKPEKEMARKMIVMTRTINETLGSTEEHQHVTCFTCHRGDHHPKTAPDPTPPAAN